MALDTEAKARLEAEANRIAAIKDETARDAALAKAAKGANDPAEAFDNLNNRITEILKQQSKHTLSADADAFNTKKGTIRTEVGFGVNGSGLTGGNATVFTGVMDNKTWGAASVGVTGSMNSQGQLGDPSLLARYVSPPLIGSKNIPVEAVIIGATSVTIPTNDRKFGGADVPISVGTLGIHKETGVALTLLATTDATGRKPSLWGRLGGNVYEDDKTRLALNINGGVDTATGQANVGAGLFVDHKIDSSNTVYAGAGFTVNDVAGKNDKAAMFTFGGTFDVMPASRVVEKSSTSELPSKSMKDVSLTAIPEKNLSPSLQQQPAIENKPGADLNYNFLELNRRDQHTVLNIMAAAFKKEHKEDRPDMTMREAREVMLDRLAASNYFVNAHETKSYRDDTVLENTQVASR